MHVVLVELVNAHFHRDDSFAHANHFFEKIINYVLFAARPWTILSNLKLARPK